MFSLRSACAALAVCALALLAPDARAEGTLIVAPGRTDSFTTPAGLIYISSGAKILRYQLSTGKFAEPIQVGGNLGGLDISPDGQTLAVADRSTDNSGATIDLIDLKTLVVSPISFARDFYEAGTYTCVWNAQGKLYITSSFKGSGWVPLRIYDPADGDLTANTPSFQVRQDTMLSPSGDRSIVAFAESNSSGGEWGTLGDGGAELLRSKAGENGTEGFNYEIAANHDGTQFGIPTYKGTFIYDDSRQRVQVLGKYAGPRGIGIAYHPTLDRLYLPWSGTSQIYVFDSTNFKQIGVYDFEKPWGENTNRAFGNGRTKVSRDGSLLAATVAGGVRFVRLKPNAPPLVKVGLVK